MELHPYRFVSFFVLYIFSYLLSKTMGCFSGCLMSSAGIQKLFCGIYSAFKCSFDEFVGEKVVSPPFSSAILRPCLLKKIYKGKPFPQLGKIIRLKEIASTLTNIHNLGVHSRLLWEIMHIFRLPIIFMGSAWLRVKKGHMHWSLSQQEEACCP